VLLSYTTARYKLQRFEQSVRVESKQPAAPPPVPSITRLFVRFRDWRARARVVRSSTRPVDGKNEFARRAAKRKDKKSKTQQNESITRAFVRCAQRLSRPSTSFSPRLCSPAIWGRRPEWCPKPSRLTRSRASSTHAPAALLPRSSSCHSSYNVHFRNRTYGYRIFPTHNMTKPPSYVSVPPILSSVVALHSSV